MSDEFRCPKCDDSVFELLTNVYQFIRDGTQLDGKLPGKPRAVALWRCLSCRNYLIRHKEGTWGVMERDQKASDTPKMIQQGTAPVVKPQGGW